MSDTGSLFYVTLDQLEPAPDNVRKTMTDIDDLAASIRANGVLTPFTITKNGSDKYKVVAGHRRMAAIEKIVAEGEPAPAIPALLLTLEDAERITAMVVENTQRQDLNPVEEAEGFGRLVELGMTQEQIATKVGRNQSHVSKRLSLLRLPERVQQVLIRGTITVEVAQLLAKLNDQDLALALVEAKGSDLQEFQVERAIKQEKAAIALAKLIDQAVKAGLPVIERSELTDNYSHTGDTAGTVKDAKALTEAEGWTEDHYLVGIIGYDDKPKLSVYAPRRKQVDAEGKPVKDDAQKRAAKLERLRSKYETETIVGICAKPNQAKMRQALLEDFFTHDLGDANAAQVVRYLDIEPIRKEEKFTDYGTGEVRTRKVTQWRASVLDWAGQSDKQYLQAVMALMVVRYGYMDKSATRRLMEEAGYDKAAINEAAKAALDG